MTETVGNAERPSSSVPASGSFDGVADAGLALVEELLSRLPESAAAHVGTGFGELAYRPLRLRRGIVERQIRAAFPERPATWVRRVARDCYRHFGREAVSTVRVSRAGLGYLLTQVINPEEPAAVYRRHVPPGSGALVVGGHLGNWELLGAFLAASGLSVTAVVRRSRTGPERRMSELRRRLGMDTFPMNAPASHFRRALSEGRVLGLVADQNAAARGVPVSFLGRSASTFRGPARLAIALGVPLFFGAFVREGTKYRASLRVVPIPEPASGSELELTRRWVTCLEEAVRVCPEQYFWFHRRWKLAEDGRPSR